MAITVKHNKVSTIPDDADTSLVRPSDWNDDHVLTGTVPVANGGTGASTLTGYVKGNGTSAMTATATVPSTDITGLGTMSTQNSNNISVTGGSMSGVTISDYIPTTQKAAALGVATLDSASKVPISQIPDSVIGALSYQGTWNASTNTPTLTSSVGTKGYYYVVSVAGSTNLNGITDWQIGDWAVYNGTIWQKVDNTDSVTSVNTLTGAVVLTTTNIAEGTNLYYTDARSRAALSAGTGISYNSTTGVITNASPSLGGDVVGPASATDNAIARFDATTGKLLQNSVVTVGDTGAVAGVTTLAASTSVTTPIVQATNSGGLALKNSGGTTQMSVGAGGGDNMSINVSTNLNGTNAQIDISPTGTGHVHIKPSGTGAVEIAPTSAGTMNNMVIGGTTPLAITGTTITATTFVGSGASLTGVVTSVGATSPVASSGGQTPTISMPAATTSVSGYLTSTDWNTFNNKGSGTVTSVSATAPITSSGGATPNLAMPAATTSVNGYLTSTDWTTFNGKQALLVSGTNIKTINTNSILGSGDLTIAATPAGSTTQVQYNNAGSFAGSAGFLYDATNGILNLSGSTGALTVPNGTTAQRPGTPAVGMSRWNTTLSQYEIWNGNIWQAITGGSYAATYLIIAGGGSGGGNRGGGGGAGGFLTSTTTLATGTAYTVTVGAGGAGTSADGVQGSNSSAFTITATGGGSGGSIDSNNGGNGGSGGGGPPYTAGALTGGTGTVGQGNNGGNGVSGGACSGGGGGASAVGSAGLITTSGNGGNGTASTISGSSVTYAGGGGGGGGTIAGSGGTGGGGAGGAGNTGTGGVGVAGTANTGSGGGGSGRISNGANGGSGIVIISYAGNQRGIGGTVTSSGGNTIHTFTSSGTYSA